MPGHFSPEINEHLLQLHKGNNHYIYLCLRAFAEKKLDEIDAVCKRLRFEDDTSSKTQHAYLYELEQLNYIKALVKHELKPVHKDSFYLCSNSLANYIYRQNEALKDAELFTMNAIKNLSNDTNDLLDKIDDIKHAINGYKKLNKRPLVAEFNDKVNSLSERLQQQPFHLVGDAVKQDLAKQLDQLQTQQNAYYDSFRFFKQRRKDSSTLQPRIDMAQRLLKA